MLLYFKTIFLFYAYECLQACMSALSEFSAAEATEGLGLQLVVSCHESVGN